jgi:hypothetical protein
MKPTEVHLEQTQCLEQLLPSAVVVVEPATARLA